MLPLATASALIFFASCVVFWILLEADSVSQKPRAESTQADDAGEATSAVKRRLEPAALTISSLRQLLSRFSEVGAYMALCWVCENRPLYEHMEIGELSYLFWPAFALFLVAAMATLRKNKAPGAEILNREQAEEWKGWTQYLFLAYHYCNFSPVHNAVRVFIAVYIWMAGFGNFSFFYLKDDFSLHRMISMLWRLNFLVVLLMMTMNSTYILYYICPLQTFYFLLNFVVMRCGREYNLSKWGPRLKIMVTAIAVYVIWDVENVFDAIFFFLSTTIDMKGVENGVRSEVRQRNFQ